MLKNSIRLLSLLFFPLILTLSACSVFEDNSKDNLVDGEYEIKYDNVKPYNVVVSAEQDSIVVFDDFIEKNGHNVDTSKKEIAIFYSETKKEPIISSFDLKKTSLDIDFLTLIFKFRPTANSIPPQLNSAINGGLFIGYREDDFKFSYNQNVFNMYKRKLKHYAFSYGVIAGLGTTAVNHTTTEEKETREYEGIVGFYGITGIVGIDKFSIGIVLGADNLLDYNNKNWVYKNKPWLSLGLGLNLN